MFFSYFLEFLAQILVSIPEPWELLYCEFRDQEIGIKSFHDTKVYSSEYLRTKLS